MKNITRTLLLQIFFVLTFAAISRAQEIKVSGVIIDSISKQAIPFANVVVDGTKRGTAADINGKFSITLLKSESIRLVYLGYRQEVIPASVAAKQYRFYLIPNNNTTREVEVIAGENPALRIIRLAIENRFNNNPNRLNTFQYRAHNKLTVRPDPNALRNNKLPDSIVKTLDSIDKVLYLFFSENITLRKYKRFDKSNDKIIANRIAGMKELNFTSLATDFQSFGFYDTYINILSQQYLNPISNPGYRLYDYTLESARINENGDTSFIISFDRRKGKNFKGFKGVMAINSKKYGFENLTALRADTGLLQFKVQQNYRNIEGNWFPVQIHSDLNLLEYPVLEGVSLLIEARSFMDDIKINEPLNNRDFIEDHLEIVDGANQRPDSVWEKLRVDSFSVKEKHTVHFMDSVFGQVKAFSKILKFIDYATLGIYPIGFIDIDLNKIWKVNGYEGNRLGAGFHTNDKMSRYVNIGGYAGYGTKDKVWKYGGDLIFNLNRRRALRMHFEYANDIREAGQVEEVGYRNLLTNEDVRLLWADRYDKIEQYRARFTWRPINNVQAEFGGRQFNLRPNYFYAFNNADFANANSFNISEYFLGLRYTHREKFMMIKGRRTKVGNELPVFSVWLSKGVKDQLNGDFDYHKAEFRFEYGYKSQRFGKQRLMIQGGMINGNLPYGMLFNGKGSEIRRLAVQLDNHFQTMGMYEFTNSRYINLQFHQSFDWPLYNLNWSRPTPGLIQGVGFGMLDNTSAHQHITVKDYRKGYYESGFKLDNLLRMKYVGIAYLGFGAGVMYRWGPYSVSNGNFNKNSVYFLASTFEF